MVAAAKGESLWITGNGRDTVLRLIEDQLNSDPRRGDAEEFPLETIVLEREPAMRLLLERPGPECRGRAQGWSEGAGAAQWQCGHRLHRRRAP